jgi:hypothetical protein
MFGHQVGFSQGDDGFTMRNELYLVIMIVSVIHAHELAYREGISYVAVAHHVDVLLMSQLTMYWSASPKHQLDVVFHMFR